MKLAGKTALVTGAQQGVGRAIVVALARDGADVAIHSQDDEATARCVAGEARALGRRTLLVQGDVSRRTEVEAMVSQVVKHLGTPDIVVNNAGVFPRVAFLDMADEDWDHVLDINLKGSFLTAQAGARAMVAAGRSGAIVNVSSSAVRGDPSGVHDSASRAGMSGLTRAMAVALAPYRIRVNAIAPGETDAARLRHGVTEDRLAAGVRATPPCRVAEPDEIVRVAVFLTTEKAAWITGEVIHVNGGVCLA